jgi:sec-independent protein translocase protein TatA
MGRIGFPELLLILIVILLIFGARRLPEIGQALGKAIREFKKAMEGGCSCKDDQDKSKP